MARGACDGCGNALSECDCEPAREDAFLDRQKAREAACLRVREAEAEVVALALIWDEDPNGQNNIDLSEACGVLRKARRALG